MTLARTMTNKPRAVIVASENVFLRGGGSQQSGAAALEVETFLKYIFSEPYP
jgi:hypothetical protein